MSYTFPGGARRPIIDINSENLVFIWNLPRWIDIGDIKRSLQPKYGRIKFVETFEAWRDGKRMGQIILDFATSSALSDFARAISSKEEFNYEGVEFMRFDPKVK
uniref:RRM domain-containing protein n=1 Tax=Globodera pallida TaxID=36090 RepID=A0A183CRK2_GLOPA